jgi:hypothetical protein
VHWALRREELCDPGLCPDAPDHDGQRCDHCPLDRLDAAQCAEKGLLIRRALELMGALKLGVQIGLEEIRADEFCAMLIVAEERDLLEREKSPPKRTRGHENGGPKYAWTEPDPNYESEYKNSSA